VEFVIVLAILTLVVLVVTAPLRRAQDSASVEAEADELAHAARLEELDAAREAKYREIRDADLDHRTGKLSDEDYASLDQSLRAEAVEILRELDRVAPAGSR
jgi:Tfp pilus assembly protein FimT